MVDEYQDTNEVQNCIFSAISREGKNLFTVGDVKQSIYRFRLADPRIFLDHYLRYPHAADAAEGESAKLLLSKNFRSRDTVLDAANFVFRNVLSREMGELDYGEDESLHVGASYPENPDCCTEFHFVEMSAQESDTEKLRAARAEASFVADYIQRLIAGGFTVQDDKTHEPRAVREEDIVILMRSPRTRLADYRRALESRGLHCAAESDGGFYETMEVAVTFALLEILDNPRQDVPLISVLRSPLFGFTPDRLAELRAKTPGGDFYDALAADGGEDSARFLALLRELRESAQTLTLTELVAALYERCHIPAVFGAMRGGAARRENLRAFFSLAEEFERGGGRGLFAFVRHLREQLESLSSRKEEIGDAILSAKTVSQQIISDACVQSEKLLSDSRLKAKQIIAAAQEKKEHLLAEAAERQEYCVRQAEKLYSGMRERQLESIEALDDDWQNFLCGLMDSDGSGPSEEDLSAKVGAIARELAEIDDE